MSRYCSTHISVGFLLIVLLMDPVTFLLFHQQMEITFFYEGALDDNYGGRVDCFKWGWTFNIVLEAMDQAARDIFVNYPQDVAQILWEESRLKYWEESGGEIYTETRVLSAWTQSPGVVFPNQYRQDPFDFSLIYYPWSRLAENNYKFKHFKHPGISEQPFLKRPDNHPAEAGLYYANFIAQFTGRNGTIAAAIPFYVKLLIRNSISCPSDRIGNAEIGTGHILIPDWQSPPVGIQLP
ncbi:MAG: hypothetical protein ACOX5R_07370 [bacterium]|jgi:hypothetical protein